MRRSLLLVFCALLGVFHVQAEKKFTVISDYAIGKGMSPNGRYVVGIDPTLADFGVEGMSGFSSFLWDAKNGTLDWLTKADADECAGTGSFTDVTDDQVISGFFKDPNYQITVTEWEGDITLPVNVAAIWKEGKVTSLGIGDFKLSEFENFADGSYAEAISNDAKTVIGYVAVGNFAYCFPCVWKYDTATEKWNFARLSLPEGALGGRVFEVSGDGKVIAGTVWFKRREVPAVWKDGQCILIEGRKENGSDDTIYNKDYAKGGAFGVSLNGKYVAFKFNEKVPAIYSVDEDKYIKLKEYEDVTGLDFSAVADNGDLFGAYNYGNGWSQRYTRTVFRSYASSQMIDFEYFLSLCAADIEIPLSFNFEQKDSATPKTVSADGKTLLGNNGYTVWVLQTDNNEIVVPDVVENIQAKIADLKQVTLTWDKNIATTDFTPQSYNVYCDGTLIGSVAGDVTQMTYQHEDVNAGVRLYSVSCVYKNKATDAEIESPRAEPVSLCMPSTFDLPFFDNFDSQSVRTNFWTVTAQRQNTWKINFGAPMYQGIGWTAGMVTDVSMDRTPYSAAIESRFMDAREEDHVYFSFLKRFLFLNSNDWDLTADTLSVEVAMAGSDKWVSVKDYLLKANEASYWVYEYLDLSKYAAHSLFQIRMRVHGKGWAQYTYNFDLFKVGTELECEAPVGLIGNKQDGKLHLAWKNELNAYELSYAVSYYEESVVGQALGDEGKPFIAANSFETNELSLYDGKYLTSVTAFINHDLAVENSKDTHASVVVFENGKLIREQELTDIEINKHNTLFLDEPVKIDASKELKIGVKIYDYDERQIPLSFQITNLFKPGKSDLYSQDGGKTWLKISDFYAEQNQADNGRCCWEIVGNITDEKEVARREVTEEDVSPVAYTLYRNGERINYLSLFLPPHFIDESPLNDNDYYEVRAYYEDGRTSELSAQYSPSMSSVETVEKDHSFAVYYNPDSDRISLNGDFSRATLYSIDGQSVATTTGREIEVNHLSDGIYILKIENGNKVENHKVMIKR